MARRRSSIPGVSFSAKRALGVTSAKRKVARATGIPTTRSGRRAKAGRMMGCATMILIAFLIVTALALCASALAEEPAATVDPALESLKAKLDQAASDKYTELGAEQDSVNAFLDKEIGWPSGVITYSLPTAKVCAQYFLMPEGNGCRTGVDTDEMLAFVSTDYQLDADGNLISNGMKIYTDDEIWARFGRLLQYIHENNAAICADGFLHGADTEWVIIDITQNDRTQYQAIYQILDDELILKLME